MTVKNLFIFNAIVVFAFGLLLMIVPHDIVSFYMAYEVEKSTALNLIGRGYGTILIGLGMALITSVNAQPSLARRGILVMITIANILDFLVHLTAVVQQDENNFGWSLVVLTGVLALWGGYLLSREKVKAHWIIKRTG